MERQRGAACLQFIVVEDHHISLGEQGSVITEMTAADPVHVPAHVPLQAVGPTEGPVPQQDGDVLLADIWMACLPLSQQHKMDHIGGDTQEQDD